MAENIDLNALQEALRQFAGATEESVAKQDKINKELIAIYGAEKVLGDKQKALYKQQLANLGYIVDETGKIAKAAGSVDLSNAQKRQIARLAELDRKQKETIEAQVNLGRNLKSGVADIGKSLAGFASELASGNTSFTTLNPIIDAVANTMSSLASAIPYLGGVIGGVIKATAEGSKVILALAEKNLKTFQDLSSVGATVVDGITGLQTQILTSGMSMDGFVKLTKSNSEILARFGGTVGNGLNKISDSIGMLTKREGPLAQAGMELRKLGLTADDIGERAAAYLEQEMLLGRGRNMNAEQLAKGTVAYTKELTALQKVTGKQREEIENDRRKLMGESRFRAMSAELEQSGFKAGADKIRDLIIAFPKDMEEGLKELSVGKGVLGPASAKIVATFGSEFVYIFDKLRTATTSEEANKYADEVINNAKRMAKVSSESLQGISQINPDVYVNFATQLDLANDAMPMVMYAAQDFTDAMVEAINKLKSTFGVGPTVTEAPTPDYSETSGGAATGAPTKEMRKKARERLRQREGSSSSSGNAASPTATSVPGLEDDPLAKLNFGGRRGERTGGGDAKPSLISKANQVAEMFPDAIFTALNDVYHKTYHPNSAHTDGRALDFALSRNPPKNAQEAAQIVAQLKEIGFVNVKDEYFKGDKYTTGPHFHAEVSAKYGGIASGPQTGFPAMLHGPKEAIIPLATDSILEKLAKTPASQMSSPSSNDSLSVLALLSEKLDKMIDKLSDANNIQDQILRYSRI